MSIETQVQEALGNSAKLDPATIQRTAHLANLIGLIPTEEETKNDGEPSGPVLSERLAGRLIAAQLVAIHSWYDPMTFEVIFGEGCLEYMPVRTRKAEDHPSAMHYEYAFDDVRFARRLGTDCGPWAVNPKVVVQAYKRHLNLIATMGWKAPGLYNDPDVWASGTGGQPWLGAPDMLTVRDLIVAIRKFKARSPGNVAPTFAIFPLSLLGPHLAGSPTKLMARLQRRLGVRFLYDIQLENTGAGGSRRVVFVAALHGHLRFRIHPIDFCGEQIEGTRLMLHAEYGWRDLEVDPRVVRYLDGV